jgi:hypothetical protein
LSLKDIRVHEYYMRFLFGGLCTVAAGLIAERYGPAIGGFFLAFPPIFPASASLLEAHEKRKMANAGLDGADQGRAVPSVDAAGASIGCIGLIAIAAILRRTLPEHSAPIVIAPGYGSLAIPLGRSLVCQKESLVPLAKDCRMTNPEHTRFGSNGSQMRVKNIGAFYVRNNISAENESVRC